MTKYILKYNFLILFLRLTAILGFIWTAGQVLKVILGSNSHVDKNGLGLLAFMSIPTFLIYRILKRLVTETNLITLDKNKIEIYNIIKFKKTFYSTTDCVFFRSYRTPFNSIILKVPTGKYIHILSYDYFDFKKLDKIFADHEIQNEGYISDTTT